ncbi:MAG: serpin family protein [Planctomycetota bacterium]
MAETQDFSRRGNRQGDPLPGRRRLHVEPLEDRRLLSAARAVEAINLFALDVYEQMQREDGNLFFSPLSIATGLSMAYAGAAGQTAAEIEQVVHLGLEPGIHAAFAELVDSIESHNGLSESPKLPHVLTMANGIWPAVKLPVEQGFLDIMQGEYAGHVENVDYGNPRQAEEIINQWVSNNTEGKIPDLVSDLSPQTVMVLTNAVYFNGYWENRYSESGHLGSPFDPRFTGPQEFTKPDGQTISVPTMYTEIFAPYTTFDGFQVLELPFEGGSANADYSMVFVLPPEIGNPQFNGELVSQIDAWLNDDPADTLVQVSMPKIDTEVSTNLNQLLKGLGMPTAFYAGADFSAMTPGGVWISDVFHKATLTLNEQGTTAAAATKIEFSICFAAGTPVLTPGAAKPIEQLKPGDLVLARDQYNLEEDLEPRVIEEVYRNEAEIIEIRVNGQTLRTTAPHPFFVQAKGWTKAGELRPGDKLSTDTGDWAEVEGVEFTKEVEQVYDLCVADHHTYFVGREEWGFAVWVHNSCFQGDGAFIADRPYHLLLRDNITGVIAFMGRIDDPAQMQNEINPSVRAVSGDFDQNHVVDGNDFLAWQRGHGTTDGAQLADGDSDADGDVDDDDLGVWEASFGTTHTESPAGARGQELEPVYVKAPEIGVRRDIYAASIRRELIDLAMDDGAVGARNELDDPTANGAIASELLTPKSEAADASNDDAETSVADAALRQLLD